MSKTWSEVHDNTHKNAQEIKEIMYASPFFDAVIAVRKAAAENSFDDSLRNKLEGIIGMAEAGYQATCGDLLAVAHGPTKARQYAERMEQNGE